MFSAKTSDLPVYSIYITQKIVSYFTLSFTLSQESFARFGSFFFLKCWSMLTGPMFLVDLLRFWIEIFWITWIFHSQALLKTSFRVFVAMYPCFLHYMYNHVPHVLSYRPPRARVRCRFLRLLPLADGASLLSICSSDVFRVAEGASPLSIFSPSGLVSLLMIPSLAVFPGTKARVPCLDFFAPSSCERGWRESVVGFVVSSFSELRNRESVKHMFVSSLSERPRREPVVGFFVSCFYERRGSEPFIDFISSCLY
uniref:Rab-GAP TBC domain-containing protein n=1 Tax=Ascaris lumbricoides TaxID=6252 RepID=A0A0M3I698_ASCLU